MPGEDSHRPAMRPPLFSQCACFFLARTVVEVQQFTTSNLDSEIARGPDVRSTFGKKQVDFRRPAADALDAGQFFNSCLIIRGKVFKVDFSADDQLAQRPRVALLLP